MADRCHREVSVVALDQHLSIHEIDDKTCELIIGHRQWPFPIPLVDDPAGWRFDTAAGKLEVLARRIGRNELATITALHTTQLCSSWYEQCDWERVGATGSLALAHSHG